MVIPARKKELLNKNLLLTNNLIQNINQKNQIHSFFAPTAFCTLFNPLFT